MSTLPWTTKSSLFLVISVNPLLYLLYIFPLLVRKSYSPVCVLCLKERDCLTVQKVHVVEYLKDSICKIVWPCTWYPIDTDSLSDGQRLKGFLLLNLRTWRRQPCRWRVAKFTRRLRSFEQQWIFIVPYLLLHLPLWFAVSSEGPLQSSHFPSTSRKYRKQTYLNPNQNGIYVISEG